MASPPKIRCSSYPWKLVEPQESPCSTQPPFELSSGLLITWAVWRKSRLKLASHSSGLLHLQCKEGHPRHPLHELAPLLAPPLTISASTATTCSIAPPGSTIFDNRLAVIINISLLLIAPGKTCIAKKHQKNYEILYQSGSSGGGGASSASIPYLKMFESSFLAGFYLEQFIRQSPNIDVLQVVTLVNARLSCTPELLDCSVDAPVMLLGFENFAILA